MSQYLERGFWRGAIDRFPLHQCFLILVICFSFAPVFHASYLNWDDVTHVLQNPLVVGRPGEGALRIFLTPDTVDRTYVPLSMLTFYVENFFFGFNPFIAHSINLLLHICLAFAIIHLAALLGLSRRAAYLAALLFAIHPMHVESVAWITTRKDVLYSLFYVFGLSLYVQYVKKGLAKDYIFALICATLAVLSKAMALSFPLVLFLFDPLLQRRITWKTIVEKIPFVCAVSMVASVTYIMNMRPPGEAVSFSPLLWMWSATFYVKKFFFPIGLSPVYHYIWPVSLENPQYLMACLITAMISYFLLRFRINWVWFSFAFYALSTFFLWRFDIADFSFVANRFMYLPSLGFCFLFGWLVDQWISRSKGWWRAARMGLLAALLVLCAFATFYQTTIWSNCWRLWSETIKTSPSLYNAYYQRIQCILDGRFAPTCEKDFFDHIVKHMRYPPQSEQERALLVKKLPYFRILFSMRELRLGMTNVPTFHENYSTYGVILYTLKQYEKAIPYFERSIKLMPFLSTDYFNIAKCLSFLGRGEEAERFYRQASSLAPDWIDAKIELGYIELLDKKNFTKALQYGIKIMEQAAYRMEGYDITFNAFMSTGRTDLARTVTQIEERLFPEDPQTYHHQAILNKFLGFDDNLTAELNIKADQLARKQGFTGRSPEWWDILRSRPKAAPRH